jgi:hypothetical protein
MKSFALPSSFSRLAAFVAVIAAAAIFATAPCLAQDETDRPSGARTMYIISTSGQAGTQVNVSVELDSQGDETATSFSLSWDPTIFSNPVATLGSGAPAGSSLGLNTNQAAQGRLGVLVDATIPFGLSPANRQVINLRLDIAPNAVQSNSAINFGSLPTPLSVSNVSGALLPTAYQVGTISITPSNSVPVTLGGRVTSPTGQNLRNVQVILTDSNGVRRIATTSSFGIYSFANVASGQEYTLSVVSKRYRFAPRQLTPTDNATNLDFVGLE